MPQITKASGEKSEYSEQKVRRSLYRAGASEEQADMVLKELRGRFYEGISTREIFRIAFNLLKRGPKHIAARYHLKNAIMQLGPSGFPFEKYIAELLKHQGFSTTVDQVLQGKCVTHEIDIVAKKEAHRFFIECKFHNQAGKINDVQLPLYFQARFTDVMEQTVKDPAYTIMPHTGWIISNTRFSTDAIRYGTCAGLRMLGWDYPDGKALKDQIDSFQLYPVTCITSLLKGEKQELLNRGIILCRELADKPELLDFLHIKSERLSIILDEIKKLCADAMATATAGAAGKH